MDLATIRTFIAGHLTVTGFTTYGDFTDGVELPALVVGQPKKTRYVGTYDGVATIEIPLHVLVPSADADSAQALLDRAVSTGDGSVILALWTLAELDGRPWTSLVATDHDEPGTTTVGAANVVQTDFALTIKARHT